MTSTKLYPRRMVWTAWVVWVGWCVFGISWVVSVIGEGWTAGASALLYFGLGAFYARSAALLIRVRYDAERYHFGGEMFWMTFWRVTCWPVATVFDRWTRQVRSKDRREGWEPWAVRWFTAPVRAHEEHVEDLRAKAERMWEASKVPTLTSDERKLLQDTARDYEKQARAESLD